jgi:pimeloyl-ACP methyl ester carboxylesterase
MNIARFACHGLGVVQPIDLLAIDMDHATPSSPPFVIVGGFSPPLEERDIEASLRAAVGAGKELVWVGHSMGAALGFYLPQTNPGWKFKLVITVDPMCWASNIDCPEWETRPPQPGRWRALGNYDRWINIRTRMYPGGGVLMTKDARCEDHFFPDCDHIGVIADARVRKIIFDAVKEVA